MNKRVNAILSERPIVAVFIGAAAVLALVHCGGGSSGPTTTTPPTTQATPVATPTPVGGLPAGMICDPTPPPLYRMQAKIHGYGGNRNVLDSKPVVWNVDNYCGRVGFAPQAKFCDTRPEGDLQRTACDYMATGKAGDTGRWGPTWFYEGMPCTAAIDTVPAGCGNSVDNQFMIVAKGEGQFAACASDSVPMIPEGSRCGICNIVAGVDKCQ